MISSLMFHQAQFLNFQKEIKRRQKVSVCCSCGSPGYYEIRYYVSRRGYVPGEKIMVDIRTSNCTNSLVHLILRFKMVSLQVFNTGFSCIVIVFLGAGV